jgi:hypothetical protein
MDLGLGGPFLVGADTSNLETFNLWRFQMKECCENSLADKVEKMRSEEMRLARVRKLLKAKIEPLRTELMDVETRLNKLETDRLAIERLLIKPKVVKQERRQNVRRKVDNETAEMIRTLKSLSPEQLQALQDLAEIE